MSVSEALPYVIQAVQSQIYKNVLSNIYNDIFQGVSVSDAFTRQIVYFDEAFLLTLKSGLEGGDFVGTFKRLADMYEEKLNTMLEYLMSVLPQLAFMAAAGMTLLTVIALYMPMIYLMQNMKM